jgi:hypothetical protein
MPLQKRYRNMYTIIKDAFHSSDFDELLSQPAESFTLRVCSLILRNVSIHLKHEKTLTIGIDQLLSRVFIRLNDPSIKASESKEWLDKEKHPADIIAFILYNLGCIVDGYAQKRQRFSDALPMLVTSTLNWLMCQMALCSLQAKNICDSLHGLGRLAERGKLDGMVDSSVITGLLTQLAQCKDIRPQEISNSLHGLGRLAERGKLQGAVDGNVITRLLTKLTIHHDISAQAISISLHGLGRLAGRGKLQGVVDGSVITHLLNKLTIHHDISAQAISNSLHGLGRLAEWEQLQGVVDGSVITLLLNKLEQCLDIDAQAISNSLHGLGRLAEWGKLDGTVDGSFITGLLTQLTQRHDINAQAIGNSLHGLGRLAGQGKLQGVVDGGIIAHLLNKLEQCHHVDAQAISNSLHGLGRLAEMEQLQGVVDGSVIANLLNKLEQCHHVDAQAISNSLHAIGRLAERGKLDGMVDGSFITGLLTQLTQRHDINAQAIGNSLHGLGRLAEQGKLLGVVNGGVITHLLNKLEQCHHVDAQAISNSLHGLGRLAEQGKLDGMVDSSFITGLLTQLAQCKDIRSQEISNSLHGLGRLIEHKKITAPIASRDIASLVAQFFALDLQRIECDQMVFGLSCFARQISNPQELLSQEQVLVLMNMVLNRNYIDPCRGAELLHVLTSFRHYTLGLKAVFDRLMDAVESISAKRLSPKLLAQLWQDKDALSFASDWQARLQRYVAPPAVAQRTTAAFFSSSSSSSCAITEQRRPRPSTEHLEPPRKRRALSSHAQDFNSEWNRASRDILFQAISNEDLAELIRLLGLTARPRPTRSALRSRTTTASDARQPSSRESTSSLAEQRVNTFLQETPLNALRRLISESSYEYFIPLLEACSVHGRLALAKQHHLNLILIHLPFDSLSPFIDALLRLQLYRDHQALLGLLDALTIRLDQNSDEHETLIALQKRLIDKGLEFHRRCQHHHVVARLEARERAINNNTMVLEYVGELNVDLPVPVVAQQQPVVTPRIPVSASPMPVWHPELRATASSVPFIAALPIARELQPLQTSVNPSYLYTGEDINILLRLRLHSLPYDIDILAATYLRDDVQGNFLEVLDQALRQRGYNDAPYTALIPIGVGEHWVGVKLVFEKQEIVQMVYFDSIKKEYSPDRAKIIELLKSRRLLAPSFQSVTNVNELKQLNSYDCGPLLIENMCGDCYGRYWRKPNGREEVTHLGHTIRQIHFDLLQQKASTYFERFAKQDNARTPAVSVQLGRTQPRFYNNNNYNQRPAEQEVPARRTYGSD